MDIWAQIWPDEHTEGKEHKAVISYLKWQVTALTTMEAIYRLVVRWGVEDDMDALATSRALWNIRNDLRRTTMKAITA